MASALEHITHNDAVAKLKLLAKAYPIADKYDSIPDEDYVKSKDIFVPADILHKYQGYDTYDLIKEMLSIIEEKL